MSLTSGLAVLLVIGIIGGVMRKFRAGASIPRRHADDDDEPKDKGDRNPSSVGIDSRNKRLRGTVQMSSQANHGYLLQKFFQTPVDTPSTIRM